MLPAFSVTVSRLKDLEHHEYFELGMQIWDHFICDLF